MAKTVDIDSVIANIESAITENGVRADVTQWIAKAESLAKTVTIAELDRLCDTHGGVPFIVDNEYMPDCGGCVKEGGHRSMWLFVKEMGGGDYKIFVQCAGCKAKATENIPIRICGKERAVATIAVYLREKADGLHDYSKAKRRYRC